MTHPMLAPLRQFLSFFLFFILLMAAPACGSENGGWTEAYGSYTFRFTPADEDVDGKLEIFKGIRKVYAAEGYRFMPGGADKESALPMGTSVTGRQIPEAVVVEWTGGVHCCFTFHLFEIGDRFREIASLFAGNSDNSSFTDLN